jgi:H+/Cl- antiporter ClcA
MDEAQLNDSLMSMLPTPTYLLFAIIFGVIGFAAFRYGKKTERTRAKWTGVALMLYPYAIGSDTRLLILIGTALCGVLYFYRD